MRCSVQVSNGVGDVRQESPPQGDFNVEDMAWMPAHTAEHYIGVKELGNGDKLTELGR